MQKGKIRRLLLKALNELGTGMNEYVKIINKMIDLSENKITKADLLNHNYIANKLYNSPLLESVEYLVDKGFIKWKPTLASNALGPLLFQARITAYGKDIVDDPNKLEKEIPIASQTINISDSQNIGITNEGNVNLNIEKIINEAPEDIKKELLVLKDEIIESINNKKGLKEFILKTGITTFASIVLGWIKQNIGINI